MARQFLHQGIRVFRLTADDGTTHAEVVPDFGGIVSSLFLPGPDGSPRECLFRHPWFWDPATPETRGGLPLLFPVCGRLLANNIPGLYHAHGRPFRLPIHGFAMRQPWEVAEANRPDALHLRLVDSDSTRRAYPFSFVLELQYAVAPAALTCRLVVRNPGREPLPYSAGFHPYFATPPAGGGKEQTLFSARPCASLTYNATKTDVTGKTAPPVLPLPVGGGQLDSQLLEMDADRNTRIDFPDGFEIRQTASALFAFRQLHTLPDAPFFCDEPWMAPAGALNRTDAVRLLPAGQSDSGEIRITTVRP